jgi:general secretion pathway protein A
MYNQYFGLKENPFALSPDPRYLYLSQRHQDALAHLMYGITGGGGFVLLTGEVGTGKTLMIRALLQRLPETVDVALVLYPFLTVREFMVALCDDLRIEKPQEPTLKALIDTLNRFLLDNHARGRRTVLIVDEAHRLNREVLEQIRLLTNLETTKEKLLQIVLVGQPELNEVLAQPEMRQLTQRITARYDLQALTAHDTRAYVQHRCRVAGAGAPLFTSLALWWAHRQTQGVPRLINILCDRALLAAYGRGRHKVGIRLLRAAARELDRGLLPRPRRAVAVTLAVVLAGFVAGVALWRLAPEWLPLMARAPQLEQPVVAPGEPAGQAATAAVTQPAAQSPGADGAVAANRSGPATAPVTLTQILTDPAIPTDTNTAFERLFAHWQLDYAKFEGATGCERAQQAGLRCLFESGTWNNLRLLNRPAIIELVDEAGTRHHVLVARLAEDRAMLEFPGREVEVTLTEVDRVWFGKYLLLWNPPAVGERPIRRGMRGAPVAWVREALAGYGLARPAATRGDLFDAGLESQVREFQRRHQLQDDGIVGRLTLIYLRTYDSNAQSPQLTAARDTTVVR